MHIEHSIISMIAVAELTRHELFERVWTDGLAGLKHDIGTGDFPGSRVGNPGHARVRHEGVTQQHSLQLGRRYLKGYICNASASLYLKKELGHKTQQHRCALCWNIVA
jgi:hypothetical protein